tara:strand:+ start:1629 stop:2675 length:1047 start_codon:yes stop_codon:yes gene_type:complete
MSGVFVNVGGTWKDATNYFVNVNGTWKEGNEINARMGTDWKDSGIIKDNLTIHYDGYNTNSYSNNTTTANGTTWKDLSGNNFDGVVETTTATSNSITWDNTEKAMVFSSTPSDLPQNLASALPNNDIAIKDLNYVSGSSDGITNLTVACWCKSVSGTISGLQTNGNTTTRGAHDQRIIASFDRSSVWRLSIGSDGAGANSVGKIVFGYMGVNLSNGVESFAGDNIGGSNVSYDLRDDSWHYVAVTFSKLSNSSLLKFYLDGQPLSSRTYTTSFAIGGGTDPETPTFGFIGVGSEARAFSGTSGPRQMFAGKIGAFHYYTSTSGDSTATLTDAQILHNFNALKYRYGFT